MMATTLSRINRIHTPSVIELKFNRMIVDMTDEAIMCEMRWPAVLLAAYLNPSENVLAPTDSASITDSPHDCNRSFPSTADDISALDLDKLEV